MKRTLFSLLLIISLIPISNADAGPNERASLATPKVLPSAQSTYDDIQNTVGLVPGFLKAYPEESIAGAWLEMKSIQLNPETAISGKYKELIGLSVAAQIPCPYCTYFHTEAAKLNGAVDAETREAIALSAATRHWSTYLNGMQLDFAAFKKETDRAIAFLKKKNEKNTAGDAGDNSEAVIRTPEEAYRDIEKSFGFVPTFLKMFPTAGIVGAWTNMKSLEFGKTSISAKEKCLLGLAVSSQVPCQYCVYFHTEAAKLDGATEQEIQEAVAMASITRQWSTVLNGNRPDEKTFRDETNRIIAFLKNKNEKSVK